MAKAVLFHEGDKNDALVTLGVEISTEYLPEDGSYTIRTEMSPSGVPVNAIVLTAAEAKVLCQALMTRFGPLEEDTAAPDKALMIPHIDLEAQVSYEGNKWETIERGDDVDELMIPAFKALTRTRMQGERLPVSVRVVEVHTHAQFNWRDSGITGRISKYGT